MKSSAVLHFILAAVFAVLALGSYVVAYVAFSSAREDAVSAATEVARIEHEDAAIASAEDTLAALAAEEAALNSYFVSADGIVPFLERLEAEGETLGSLVEVVSVTPVSEGRLTLSLRIEGSFTAVMRTLGGIEFGPYDIRMTALTLDTPPTGDDAIWVGAATFSIAALEETP